MHPHLTRNVSQNFMPIFQFDSKHGIGQRFRHRPGHFYDIFLGHLAVCLPSLMRQLRKDTGWS
ncbi:MAG: hypothetical protein NBKEAIPA_01532 [Nitrospirae bacterium]|nr:hypothetical protein [Nitrospirota bacterium]